MSTKNDIKKKHVSADQDETRMTPGWSNFWMSIWQTCWFPRPCRIQVPSRVLFCFHPVYHLIPLTFAMKMISLKIRMIILIILIWIGSCPCGMPVKAARGSLCGSPFPIVHHKPCRLQVARILHGLWDLGKKGECGGQPCLAKAAQPSLNVLAHGDLSFLQAH